MNTTRYVTVRSFDHRSQADMLMLVMLVMQQHDIPARLADEHIVAMEWALANAIGGIKVQVPISQEAEALKIIEQLKANAKPADDDACLSCGTSMPEDMSTCDQCGWSFDP